MKDYENIPMLRPTLDYLNVNGECDYFNCKLKTVMTHYIRENNEIVSLRKYDIYSYEKIEHVVYSYLFEYFSYYLLDRDVLNLMKPTGDKSREILLNLGIDEDFKNYFKEVSPYEAIRILKDLSNKRNDIRYKLISHCIDRHVEYWDLFGWFYIRDNCAMKLLNINAFAFKGIGIPDYMEGFWGIDHLKSVENPVYFIFNDNKYEVNIEFFYRENDNNSFFGKGYELCYKEYYINWEKSGFQKDIINVLSKIDKFCHKNYKYPDIKFDRISEDTYRISLMKTINEEIDISKSTQLHGSFKQDIMVNNNENLIDDINNDYNIESKGENVYLENYDLYTILFEPIDDNVNYATVIKKYREGQADFRKKVLKAYNNKCAISGETCIQALEAAHIQDYINEKSNNIQNGIPLRKDIHTLFDQRLISIDEEYIIHVSSQITSETYSIFDNKKINLPFQKKYYPSKKALKYHNKHLI